MGKIIKRLEAHVANQIAAGEVVQRPSSALKELLENAVDSGADKIEVFLGDGGKQLIQVVDNGQGIDREDLPLSIERHATSKLTSAEDLFRLQTKGFRGEALASIASIAQLRIQSKTVEAEEGYVLSVQGSSSMEIQLTPSSQGTIVTVQHLFYNIPARRQFLKSATVELKHCLDEFHRLVLVHPEISFGLHHNSEVLFQLPQAPIKQRITQVFGQKYAEKLVPISEQTPLVGISGFILKPDMAKKSRGMQYFFVNDRFIKSGFLHHAVLQAFEGLVNPGVHPGYFIYLQVDPARLDVNIHPTKTEVKFDDEQGIYAILRSAVKHSLGQFQVAPILDFDKDPNLDTPYAYQSKNPVYPKIEVDRNFNPFNEHTPAYKSKPSQTQWETLYSLGDDPHRQTMAHFESQQTSLEGWEQETKTAFTSFQWEKKYIVTKHQSALLVIHQSRAHQRIVYERLLAQMTMEKAGSQTLLFPLTLGLSIAQQSILASMRGDLQAIGFEFDEQSIDQVLGIPMDVLPQDAAQVLIQLVDELESIEHTGFSTVDRMAQLMSKSMAINTGKFLSVEEQLGLINDLFSCKEPEFSPDRKPVIVSITAEELLKKFSL
ncbi:MAG: DNA mismatch repair endonuclease MutL [Flavobacteriaceae bacterium]